MPIGAIGAVSLGGSLLGAGAQMFGASKAAASQEKMSREALAMQERMWQQSRGDAMPFIQGGQGAFNKLLGRTDELSRRFAPTMEELEKTPGYKFSLDQVLKSGQNSFAAKGLGSSGAAVKGAQDRALGLASTTYQQQLDNYMKQNQNEYNMLMGEAGIGSNAASASGNQAAQFANMMGNNLTGIGNAQAGAWMAGTNALAGGLNNATNQWMQQDMLSRLLAVKNPNAGL